MLQLYDSAPLFAPPGKNANDYTKSIISYFDQYRIQVRDAQSRVRNQVPWGQPVQVQKPRDRAIQSQPITSLDARPKRTTRSQFTVDAYLDSDFDFKDESKSPRQVADVTAAYRKTIRNIQLSSTGSVTDRPGTHSSASAHSPLGKATSQSGPQASLDSAVPSVSRQTRKRKPVNYTAFSESDDNNSTQGDEMLPLAERITDNTETRTSPDIVDDSAKSSQGKSTSGRSTDPRSVINIEDSSSNETASLADSRQSPSSGTKSQPTHTSKTKSKVHNLQSQKRVQGKGVEQVCLDLSDQSTLMDEPTVYEECEMSSVEQDILESEVSGELSLKKSQQAENKTAKTADTEAPKQGVSMDVVENVTPSKTKVASKAEKMIIDRLSRQDSQDSDSNYSDCFANDDVLSASTPRVHGLDLFDSLEDTDEPKEATRGKRKRGWGRGTEARARHTMPSVKLKKSSECGRGVKASVTKQGAKSTEVYDNIGSSDDATIHIEQKKHTQRSRPKKYKHLHEQTDFSADEEENVAILQETGSTKSTKEAQSYVKGGKKWPAVRVATNDDEEEDVEEQSSAQPVQDKQQSSNKQQFKVSLYEYCVKTVGHGHWIYKCQHLMVFMHVYTPQFRHYYKFK